MRTGLLVGDGYFIIIWRGARLTESFYQFTCPLEPVKRKLSPELRINGSAQQPVLDDDYNGVMKPARATRLEKL